MDTLNSLRFFSTEIILGIGAIGVLLLDSFLKNKRITAYLTLFILGLSAIPLSFAINNPSPFALFYGMVILDPLGLFFKVLFLIATFLVILLSLPYRQLVLQDSGAYNSLLLFSAIGLILMATATNLLMVYLAVEMVSLISYLLVGYLKMDRSSSEGGLKYFLFGAASTGMMLYGISLIYCITGTLDIVSLTRAMLLSAYHDSPLTIIALIFILVGIGFKIAFVPFHMWAPDAYESAPTPITAFISVGSKAAGIALLLRIMAPITQVMGMLEILTILTMTAGNIIAISQTNIKRMLAYSSIAQAGYILIGFVVGTTRGLEGILIYLVAYLFMNIGAFGIVVAVYNAFKTDRIEDYAGLSQRSGGLAFMLTLFLLSLSGIPPLAGFLGKFYVFSAAVENNMIGLAIVGVVNSVIALYYYVKVIRYMYLVEPEVERPETILKPFSLKIALGISLAGTLIVGIMPAPFIEWVAKSVY